MRKKDLKLVQVMERCELRQGARGDLSTPSARKFECPDCKKLGRKMILENRSRPDCGYAKGVM